VLTDMPVSWDVPFSLSLFFFTEKSLHASEAFVIIVPILFLSVQENEIMHMDWISWMYHASL
jgi:hypothetical protein